MTFGFYPISKELLQKQRKENKKVEAYRVRDMIPFVVTGIGENVFIIKDRHGLEHTRQFSGFWLLKIKIKDQHEQL